MLSASYLVVLLVGITSSSDCNTYRDTLRSASNVDALGYYEVQCQESDPTQYEPRQCLGSTGRCWCVDKWGTTITDSDVNPGQPAVDCTTFGWCSSAVQALMANMGDDSPGRMVGSYLPTCSDTGNFAKQQQWGSTGQSWCVVENGSKVPGTTTGPTEKPYDCGNLPACLAAEAEVAHKQVEGRYPFGLDRPECDGLGLYQATQCDLSTGHCWCVSPLTGDELEGTRKGPGEGTMDCTQDKKMPGLSRTGGEASACQKVYNVQVEYLEKQENPMPGFWMISCEDDGSYTPSQCHPSTGSCWCVHQDGSEVAGSRSLPGGPRSGCLRVPPTCTEKRGSRSKELERGMMVGMFLPECDEEGHYQNKQCWSSTGECWCVDKRSGKEVSFSRKSAPESASLECSEMTVGSLSGVDSLQDSPPAGEVAASSGSGSTTPLVVVIVILAVLLVGVAGLGLFLYRRRNQGPLYTGVNDENDI